MDKRDNTYYFSCPTCRCHTELPEGGVGALPAHKTLKEMILEEVHVSDPHQSTTDDSTTAEYCSRCSKLKCDCVQGAHFNREITSPDEVRTLTFKLRQSSPATASSTCLGHREPLEIYCETCDEVICHACTLHIHKDHTFVLVADSYSKHRQVLAESLLPVKEKIEDVKDTLSALGEREDDVRERGEGAVAKINKVVEEMVSNLYRSGRKLTEQAERVTDAQLEVVAEKTKSAQAILNLLEDFEGYVEQGLKTGTRQQVLSSKKQMMEHVNEVMMKSNAKEFIPIDTNNFNFVEDDKIIESLQHIGDIVTYSYTALRQCKVKKIEQDIQASNAEFTSFILSIEAPDSSLVSVPVSSLKCSLVPVGKGGQPIHTTVTTTSTHPGVYRIHCSPSTRGTHTFRVQLRDVQLEEKKLVIPFNPYVNSVSPLRSLPGHTKNCLWGVAVSDCGHVIITDEAVQMESSKKVAKFSKKVDGLYGKFTNSRGIAITSDDFIFVSTLDSVWKLSMNGDVLQFLHKKDSSAALYLSNPQGIAISPINGLCYVADSDRHRVYVSNSEDLALTPHSFGRKGLSNGEFNGPVDVAVDDQGFVYVTDSGNHRIQKFTPNGRFVAQFGSHGPGPGQLNCPRCIAIDAAGTGLVYVSDGNHRVSVFTGDGVFVRCFGLKGSNVDRLNKPMGMTFDKKGFLYICDCGNGRVLVY